MLIFFIIYSLGFVITLFILHKFKKELGIDIYDTPPEWPEWYYDFDYDSNAKAFLTFSLFWPMAIIIFGGLGVYKMLIKLSKFIERKIK